MKNLSLLFHGILPDRNKDPLAHPELFIPIKDIIELIEILLSRGYRFILPTEPLSKNEKKVCSITFDDGYFNNSYFLPIAEKYKIPFIVFINSKNIADQKPFAWDIEYLAGSRGILTDYNSPFSRDPSLLKKLMESEIHRPFTKDELLRFSKSDFVRLALHTDTHSPLIGKNILNIKRELELNKTFLKSFPNSLLTEFALPCGLYSKTALDALFEQGIQRVYTTDSGPYNRKSNLIHRISLINPNIGGKLVSQIDKSSNHLSFFKRRFSIYKTVKRLEKSI